MEKKKDDIVNHPLHYTFGKYEVLDVLEDWFPDDPLLFNATKYLPRAGKKDKNTEIEDLKKAIFYIQRKIDWISTKKIKKCPFCNSHLFGKNICKMCGWEIDE